MCSGTGREIQSQALLGSATGLETSDSVPCRLFSRFAFVVVREGSRSRASNVI